MAAGIHGLDPRTALAAPVGPARGDDALPVEGTLPAKLDGCLLQAAPHPTVAARCHGAGPQVFSGVRLGSGAARWYRARVPVRRCTPLGPFPALAPSLWSSDPRVSGPDDPGIVAFARPVRERGAARWHTVATYPGLSHAEHLVVGPDGVVLRGEPFALEGAPLLRAVALTDRYLVLLDLSVTYSPAAALVGTRPPYAWRPDRPAHIGLLPRGAGYPEPRWLPIGPYRVAGILNAYDADDHVVLDTDGPAGLRRWVLLPSGAAVPTRPFAEGPQMGTVDGRVSGRPHRHVFGSVNDGGRGAAVVRRDLAAGFSLLGTLGPGWRIGRPVFVPHPHRAEEGTGWLLVIASHAGRRRSELRVLDAPSGRPRAVIRLPAGLPVDRRTAWVPTDVLP